MPEPCLLHADDGGAGGLPVVFLHALAGHTGQWTPQLAHLRPHRRAVALDLRGHGRSPAGDGDYTLPTMAADVVHTVDRLGLERFVLVGHSGGALVALAVAGSDPARVSGLLLVDPAGDNRLVPDDVAGPFLAALASDDYDATIEAYWRTILRGSLPAVEAAVLADLKATPQAAVVGVFDAMRRFDPVAPLRQYAGPVHAVVTPANDAPFSLHRLYPALSHEVVGSTGHWLHLDRPDAFDAVLDAFLARVEARERG